MSSHRIDTPEGGFDYVMQRRTRKTVGIRVKPDGQVLVAAPMLVPHLYVKKVLRDKAGWVLRKRAEMVAMLQARAGRSLAEGEAVRWLGRDYALRFAGRSRLDEQAGVLHLGLRAEANPDNVHAALTRWYKRQARELMGERTALLAARMGRQPALVGIKSYRTRWGTCHADGRIYFNWRLVMAPLSVVDYVAAHELCHLLHPNHSPAFWQAVEELYPGHREQRSWLRRHGRMLDLVQDSS